MLYDKRMLYETDIRVPLFVSGPGIKAGQTIESPVGHIDLAPTILSMAGIETPPQMDGRSWLPLVFGGMDDGEPNVASASQVDAAAGWRHTFMVEYSGGGAPELADPDAVQAEVTFEDKHWFHSMSFQNDASAALLSSVEGAGPVYPAYYNSSCGGSASDELSIWGKCSCTATFGHSTLVHDQSPCDSVRTCPARSASRTCTLAVKPLWLTVYLPGRQITRMRAFVLVSSTHLADELLCASTSD